MEEKLKPKSLFCYDNDKLSSELYQRMLSDYNLESGEIPLNKKILHCPLYFNFYFPGFSKGSAVAVIFLCMLSILSGYIYPGNCSIQLLFLLIFMTGFFVHINVILWQSKRTYDNYRKTNSFPECPMSESSTAKILNPFIDVDTDRIVINFGLLYGLIIIWFCLRTIYKLDSIVTIVFSTYFIANIFFLIIASRWVILYDSIYFTMRAKKYSYYKSILASAGTIFLLFLFWAISFLCELYLIYENWHDIISSQGIIAAILIILLWPIFTTMFLECFCRLCSFKLLKRNAFLVLNDVYEGKYDLEINAQIKK